MEEDEDEVTTIKGVRMRGIDVGIVVLAVTATSLQALADGLDKFVYLLCAHANYKHDQAKFADAIRADLESLPTQET
jgi:hypothetical protein